MSDTRDPSILTADMLVGAKQLQQALGIGLPTLKAMVRAGLRYLTASGERGWMFSGADVIAFLQQMAEHDGRTNTFDPLAFRGDQQRRREQRRKGGA